jgi:hypothetical protein
MYKYSVAVQAAIGYSGASRNKEISMYVRTIGFLMLLALSGCVAPSQWMRGPNGDLKRCAASGFGILGAPLAEHSVHVCTEEYEKVGYKQVPDKE